MHGGAEDPSQRIGGIEDPSQRIGTVRVLPDAHEDAARGKSGRVLDLVWLLWRGPEKQKTKNAVECARWGGGGGGARQVRGPR